MIHKLHFKYNNERNERWPPAVALKWGGTTRKVRSARVTWMWRRGWPCGSSQREPGPRDHATIQLGGHASRALYYENTGSKKLQLRPANALFGNKHHPSQLDVSGFLSTILSINSLTKIYPCRPLPRQSWHISCLVIRTMLPRSYMYNVGHAAARKESDYLSRLPRTTSCDLLSVLEISYGTRRRRWLDGR